LTKLTSFTAGHIRSLYASGLYHKSEIFLRFIHELETPNTLSDILDYRIFKETRADLQLSIFGMTFVLEATNEYHDTLQKAAITEHANMLEDPKNAPADFEQIKRRTDKKLSDKLKFINKEFGTSFTVYDVKSRLFKD